MAIRGGRAPVTGPDAYSLREQLYEARSRLAAIEALVRFGKGSPEGVVQARVGTLYLRTDGGASTTLYVKQSGTAKTGWTAK